MEVEDEPAPTAVAPGIPDASFRAVGSRAVIVCTRDGGELTGQILSVEPASVSLALLPSRQVVTVARAEVVGLRLLTTPDMPPLLAPALVEQPLKPPLKPRHVSIGLGIAPGLNVNADVGMFYGFVNASLVFPAATDGNLAAFSIGAGLNFPLAKGSNWKFEVFPYLAPARLDSDGWVVGLGVGVGVHYTNPSGFTIGFKVPILGYSFGGGGIQLRRQQQQRQQGRQFLPGQLDGPAADGYRLPLLTSASNKRHQQQERHWVRPTRAAHPAAAVGGRARRRQLGSRN